MSDEKKEAVYLVDNESYLHLKETVTETGFAYETYDKTTSLRQDTGLITYEEMQDNPIRNPIVCARVMALNEIGLEGAAVSEVALRTLDHLRDAKRAYRKAHRDDPHDHDIRFITSSYEEIFRIPNGGKVQVEYPDRSFIAPCEYMDDYHTRIRGDVFHICQFTDMPERSDSKVSPEPELMQDQGA